MARGHRPLLHVQRSASLLIVLSTPADGPVPEPDGLQEPSISYVKTPSNFTSHYIKAAAFTGKECKARRPSPLAWAGAAALPTSPSPLFPLQIEKSFGQATTQVLYVFDHTKPALNVQQLTATLSNELKNMMSTMVSPVQSVFGTPNMATTTATTGA